MPFYEYLTDDGERLEKLYKASERPSFIVIPDGKTAHFIISKSARLVRGWGSANFGVNGVWNHTLKSYITSDKQHDDLCNERGLSKVTTSDFDRITREREHRDAREQKIGADIKRYESALAETKDPIQAHEIAYGAEEREIAKRANDSVFAKYPEAKAIPTQILETI